MPQVPLKQLAQDGAADAQVVAWSNANGRWEPAAPYGGGTFGSEFHNQEKKTEQAIAASTATQYTRLTTASVPAGTYRIGWFYAWRRNSTTSGSYFRLQVDDTTELINPDDTGDERHSEVAHDSGTDQRYTNSGFAYVTFGSAGTHTIDLDAWRETSGTVTLYHARLEFWRVS